MKNPYECEHPGAYRDYHYAYAKTGPKPQRRIRFFYCNICGGWCRIMENKEIEILGVRKEASINDKP